MIKSNINACIKVSLFFKICGPAPPNLRYIAGALYQGNSPQNDFLHDSYLIQGGHNNCKHYSSHFCNRIEK